MKLATWLDYVPVIFQLRAMTISVLMNFQMHWMYFLKFDSAWEDWRIFTAEVFSEWVGQASVSNDTDIILP